MKTVLVVDDEEVLRGYFSAILSRLGFNVMTADDGDTAIFVLEQNPGVDLIVLDLKMKRMGGRQAYAHLKRIKPDVKVLVSSAYVDDEEELLSMGVDAVLKKPFPILSFKSMVFELLGS